MLPVVEVFGPTIQGEGPDAGTPAYFVRFGGCDFRCRWCDSMHAVDPGQVRTNADNLSALEIVERLRALADGPQLVVISGGNPALHELGEVVERLHADGKAVAVETQGSVWRPWLGAVDRVVVSPKPPSSGMTTPDHMTQFRAFCVELDASACDWDLKVVIFDRTDLDWVERLQTELPEKRFFLSAGTDVGLDEQTTISRLRARYRWLCDSVARRPVLAGARVLPQLHVVAWGTARGV
jgi:7-carboxy-7-deazaguanine synthase